jgi:23S rRNA (guanosine2251-2'-O)-methyltransferase
MNTQKGDRKHIMSIVYGINPVKELLAQKDPDVFKIAVAKGRSGEDIQKIMQLAKKHGIAVEYKAREELDALAGRKSQGLIAFCKPFKYASLEDVIANRHPRFKNGLILVLDSVTDPQNLGSLIRTAYFFGANGVIIPGNRSASVTSLVMKTSAGTAHHLPIAMVTNLASVLDDLKKAGYWIYGADAHEGKVPTQADFNCDAGLVMGSEGSGLRPLVRKKCDLMISIPGSGDADSLNVSVSAGIILHEICEFRTKV